MGDFQVAEQFHIGDLTVPGFLYWAWLAPALTSLGARGSHLCISERHCLLANWERYLPRAPQSGDEVTAQGGPDTCRGRRNTAHSPVPALPKEGSPGPGQVRTQGPRGAGLGLSMGQEHWSPLVLVPRCPAKESPALRASGAQLELTALLSGLGWPG